MTPYGRGGSGGGGGHGPAQFEERGGGRGVPLFIIGIGGNTPGRMFGKGGTEDWSVKDDFDPPNSN